MSQKEGPPEKPFFLAVNLKKAMETLSRELTEQKKALSKFSFGVMLNKPLVSTKAESAPPKLEIHSGLAGWDEDGRPVLYTMRDLLEEEVPRTQKATEEGEFQEPGVAVDGVKFPQKKAITRDEGGKKLKAPRQSPQKPENALKKNERKLKNSL